MSEANLKGLFGKIVAARRLVAAVPKNGYNAHHKFKFATHDDVTATCKAAMDEAGLSFLPLRDEVQEVGKLTRVKVTYLLGCPDTGQSIEVTWHGDGMDSQDKGLYKAKTQAKKTWLLSFFLVPTGDQEVDGDYGHGYNGNSSNSPSKGKDSKTNSTPQKPRSEAKQTAQQTTPMFAHLPAERQQKATKKFFAIGKALGKDPYELVGNLLQFNEAKGRGAFTNSTVDQVSKAINKLIEMQKAAETSGSGSPNDDDVIGNAEVLARVRQESLPLHAVLVDPKVIVCSDEDNGILDITIPADYGWHLEQVEEGRELLERVSGYKLQVYAEPASDPQKLPHKPETIAAATQDGLIDPKVFDEPQKASA